MWARKRIDIGWLDLAFGLGCCFVPGFRTRLERATEATWPDDNTIVCLSVRSGFDLLLQALQLPRGSQLLISAVTIPDMARIIESHHLVPVPVDLDPNHMSSNLDSLAALITPQTRAVLVAHLFGGIAPMQPLIDLAKRDNLMVIEDCAQAFNGCYRGHPQSDVVAFSFGPIKTATALGGGVLTVRDPIVLQRMRNRHAQYVVQSNKTFARRVLHYGLLKIIGSRPTYRIFVNVNRWLQRDIDDVIGESARNFSTGDLLPQLRMRPSSGMLRLLRRRLQLFDIRRQRRHARVVRSWVDSVSTRMLCPGADAEQHSYWAVPIRPDDARECVARLRSAGFDATMRHSLCVIRSPSGSGWDTEIASKVMSEMVFVPMYPAMPESEVKRMRDVLTSCVANAGHATAAMSDRGSGLPLRT